MLRLLPTLVLLGALATSAGTSKTCPSCSVLGTCREITCPPAQDSCLFSQMQLENGILIKNGSCVAPEKCRESVYALTYAPHLSLWFSTSCCDNNCSRVTQPEHRPEARPNGVKCHYCSGKDPARCDAVSVMNCTGHQNVCVTLEASWDGGTSKTCPSCSVLGTCREITCPPAQDSCLFSQMQLENGILIKNGSCVAPEKCRESVYALTYAPHLSLWFSTSCCDNNCSRVTQPEHRPEAQPNGVKCHYCSGKDPARCDAVSVMNCTGHQNVCVTLEASWDGAGPQVLKGCATPEVCHLQVNTSLGPEASGFHLTSPPECNSEAPPTPPGTSKTCPSCSVLGTCREITCPPAQDSCLFSQMQLENGILIKNGSCVAPEKCRESVYALTYAPHLSLWFSTSCCDNNCSRVTQPEHRPEAQPNGVKCHYCSGKDPARCDAISVMNCTGHQNVCVTLEASWDGAGPQVLKGCATPEVCHLQVNTSLGPEASGFHLTSPPECNSEAPPTPPDPHATVTHTKSKVTTCFTCSDSLHCEPFSCPADKNYCLQTEGFLALEEGNNMAWRNGSCVASKDCRSDSLISALTYSNSFGFWINTTCCQGNCHEPTLLDALPVSRTFSSFLCPTCADSHLGLCNSSFYIQCPQGETECVQLDVASEEGGRNIRVRGCGSRDLCSARAGTEGLWPLLGHQLTGQLKCNSSLRRVIDSGAAPGLQLALPVLVAALVTWALS